MKLLGWMHHKQLQYNTEAAWNPVIGNASNFFSLHTSEQNCYVEPIKTLSYLNIKNRKSPDVFEADKVEVTKEAFEPFDFLAIGTFGLELLNTDPPTPTLPMPSGNLTNEQTSTEHDLKVLRYELEKFLEAEEKENVNDTSERSSQASIITLRNKPVDGADYEEQMYVVACPLQNYLFAKSVEMAKTDKEVNKDKTSLEESFKGNNKASDDPLTKYDGAGQETRKRNLVHFMKKVVKKVVKKFHSSSSGCKASSKNDAVSSMSIKRKFYKALKMFNQKVHPEEKTEKQFSQMQKGKKGDKAYNPSHLIGGENKMGKFAQGASSKNNKNNKDGSPNDISKGTSTVDGGHWIKTDSDYLVLEL